MTESLARKLTEARLSWARLVVNYSKARAKAKQPLEIPAALLAHALNVLDDNGKTLIRNVRGL